MRADEYIYNIRLCSICIYDNVAVILFSDCSLLQMKVACAHHVKNYSGAHACVLANVL